MAHDIDRSITQEQFVTTVAQAARIGFGQAERATEATLQTLAERIDVGEARQSGGRASGRDRPMAVHHHTGRASGHR